jgi:hypothetical protein
MLLQLRQPGAGRPGRAIRTRSASIVVRDGLVKKTHTKPHLYHNERHWLELLAHSGVTPEVLAYSDQELSITMRYSGEPIAAENAPHDWRRQLAHILSIMADAECHHGDLLPQNLLVHDGRLTLIDFALASSCGDPVPRKKRTFSDAFAPSRIGYLLSGFPAGSEVHAFVIWSMEAVSEVEPRIAERLEIIDKIVLSPLLYQDYCRDRQSWLKRFYQTPRLKTSPKGKRAFCALIVLSKAPHYAPRKRVFAPEMRIVNTELFDLKCALRAGREGYLHSSDNQEEARLNLRYLSYDESSLPYRYVTNQRPHFSTIGDVFRALNDLPETEYVLLRRPSGKSSRQEDYDILVSDYFACKRALGGVAYKSSSSKFFRNVGAPVDSGGGKVAHHVMVGGAKVCFDIRYVGDGYFPSNWQRRMLRNRVLKDGVYVCSPEDDFHARAYHALFHKAGMPRKYVEEFSTQLCVTRDRLEDHLRHLVALYLAVNNDRPTRPKDITIPFNPPSKTSFGEAREFWLVRREVRLRNYSGATKILLNYCAIYQKYWTAGYWLSRIFLHWAVAGLFNRAAATWRALGSACLAVFAPANIWQPRRLW